MKRGDRRVEHKSPLLNTIQLLMFTELTENINKCVLLAIPFKKQIPYLVNVYGI